uniref:Uncharacterized protein n=1 Tax=Rhizophora mucronata TaxID=61149 RepID=A0A2P2NGM7_RHIMU
MEPSSADTTANDYILLSKITSPVNSIEEMGYSHRGNYKKFDFV